MIPPWLEAALDATIAMAATEKAELAERILDAIPKELVHDAIMSSAHAVLKQRGIPDGGNGFSREIANNASATLMVKLAVGA